MSEAVCGSVLSNSWTELAQSLLSSFVDRRFPVPNCPSVPKDGPISHGSCLIRHPHRLAHLREAPGPSSAAPSGFRSGRHVVHLPRSGALGDGPPPAGTPSEVRLATPLLVLSSARRALVRDVIRAPSCACRFRRPQLSLCRSVFALGARIGEPAHHRNAASPFSLPGLSPASPVRAAAVVVPQPSTPSSAGAFASSSARMRSSRTRPGCGPPSNRRDGPQRGQHALLERVARLPPAREQQRGPSAARPLNRSLRALGAVVSIDFAQATQDVDVATASLRAT